MKSPVFIALLTTLTAPTVGADDGPVYDLVLHGGHVIDPHNGLNNVRDIAVTDGRIEAIAASIPGDLTRQSVDVSGLYVTPGLVDIHVHAWVEHAPDYSEVRSVFPDSHAPRSCVTTVVDTGSAGWRGFENFKRRIVDRSKTRVLAMINIVGHGMVTREREQNSADMQPDIVAALAELHPDIIVGIKTAHYDGPEWVAVDRAIEAGELAGLPVMVDFGTFRDERPFSQLLTEKLRPGDMYTHLYLESVPWFDASGNVQPFFFEARRRGVVFDTGHGGGSFSFRYAIRAMQQGFPPDTISTDLHAQSMNGGMKDMLNVISKFLNIGMTLEDAIFRSTWNPAQKINREDLGTLEVGAAADVAVMRLDEGVFGFVDVDGLKMSGNLKLECELTLRDGNAVYDLNGLMSVEWNSSIPAGENTR